MRLIFTGISFLSERKPSALPSAQWWSDEESMKGVKLILLQPDDD